MKRYKHGNINLKELERIQENLRERIILKDAFKIEEIKTIAGVDVAYADNKAFVGIALFSFPEIGKKMTFVRELEVNFPYIPRFLGFREAPLIEKAIGELKESEEEINLIMVDAHGIAHPRFLGSATHAGLLLNMPTIGVAKKLLCGEVKKNKIILNGKIVGMVLRNESMGSRKIRFREVYVSPGHKISLKTAVKITKSCFKKHRLPEPTYTAHEIATKAKFSKRPLLLL